MINDFYTIKSHCLLPTGAYNYTLQLNPRSRVYQGHFPGCPLAPGVCNIEMIKECAIDATHENSNWRLSHIKSCRMIHPLIPSKTQILSLNVIFKTDTHNNEVPFVATLRDENEVYVKIEAALAKPA